MVPAPGRELRGFIVIGAVVAVTLGIFAYDAGWLTPGALTQAKMIAALDGASGGEHPGFRRNHAKGVCASGTFVASGEATALSRAEVFRAQQTTPVTGRFALAGGNPFQADAPAKVRSMALRFQPPGAEEWRTGMNDIPVFPVRTAQGFYESLLAAVPDPKTGKPDPDKMKAFLADHPESARAGALIKARPLSSGFDNASYNSLNAFRFVAADGTSTPVRWAMVAAAPFAAADKAGDANYLFQDLIDKARAHPLVWHLVVTVATPGDPTDDATVAWPAERRHVDAGTLTIDRITSEDDGACTSVNYDPTVLPDGIALGDDPLPSARAAAYALSFTLRSGEHKPPSAVTEAAVGAPASGAKP